jgi:arylsulfatase A-like enzyme
VPDLLGVSLSTHDYINHGFGPESRISQDHLLRVDRALAAFFDYLDKRIGADNVVITLSADHGFMNAPEYSVANNIPGGRVDAAKLMQGLNGALQARFGIKENFAPRFSYPAIALDQQLIAKHSLNRAEVEGVAARFIMGIPGMAQVFTRTELENGAIPNTPLRAQVLKAWNRDVSGDLYLVQQPGVMFGSNVVTHGSPYSYDTNVPLMLYGKRWIKPGKYPRAAAVADLAPTLSYLLEIRPPSGSEGRVLDEILR